MLKLRNKLIKKSEISEYYFGYGANLNTDRFIKNDMRASEIGNGFLNDYQLDISLRTEFINKGYAGVHYKKGSKVPGVLVKIDKFSLKYLDKLEWCGFEAYIREKKDIECNGNTYSAWVYTVKKPDFTRYPSAIYLRNIINAANTRNFPDDYI